MTHSDQWKPSDIDAAAPEDDSTPAKRRGRPAGSDSPIGGEAQPRPAGEAQAQPAGRPVNSGIMTLDRDSGARDSGQGRGEPPIPTPDVHQRLRETAERCINGYESWSAGNDGESELTDALHDLRKVLARIEIELAASHADESAQRPIPIPLHRAHKHGGDTRR